MRREILLALAILLTAVSVVPLRAADEPPAKPEGAPAWQRVLEGAEAHHAKELEEQVREREAADDYEAATAAAEKLHELRERVQGADHWEAVDARWNAVALRRVAALSADERKEWRDVVRGGDTARELEQQGRFAEAFSLKEKLLEIRRKVLGEEHPHTAASYGNIAINLNARGKYAEAGPLLQKALEIRRKILGEEHPGTATSYGSLASNLHSQGKYAEAQPLHQKALEIRRKILGEEHPRTTGSYNDFAMNLNAQGKYAEAGPLLQRALEIRRKALGEEHPDTATSYNNVGINLNAQGKYAEAEPLFQKALEIWRNALGEEHSTMAISYGNLAGNLHSQGKYAKAEPLVQKALEISRKILGEEHPNTARSYCDVADNLQSQGRYAEAEPLYQKALEISRKALGEEHPNTARSYGNLAVNLQSQGKYMEAEPLYKMALEISRKVVGEEHPDTAKHYGNLAYNLRAQGKYADEEPLLQKALAIHRKALREEHPHTATSYNNVAGNLDSQGKYAKAEPLYQKALEIRRKVLGEEHPDTAGSYYNLAANLAEQGKHTEACEVLRAAVATYEAARLRVGGRGLDRATFGTERSPYRLQAAAEARARRALDAWQALESNLARGLLDEAAGRAGTVLTPAEEQERVELLARLDELQPRILALVTKPERGEAEQAELADLLQRRAVAEQGLSLLAAALSRREIATLDEVQAALPGDGAFVAWVDLAVEDRGVQEHWGCVLRASGEPAWVRMPGTGAEGAWTADDESLPRRLRVALSEHAPPERVQALAGQLSEQRLKPLAQHLENVRRLYIVGAHAMAGVPVDVLTDQFTISYVPSGTRLARSRLARDIGQPRPIGPPTLLALGDAVFDRAGRAAPAPTALPPGGLLIAQVVPGGNAAQARLQAGDVLVAYAGTELTRVAQLGPLIAAHANDESVTVTLWRETEDQTAQREVGPGKLGVALAKEPAREAIAKRRETDRMLAATRDKDWEDLPGTRVEVARIARLFPAGAVTVLTDSDASEQRLQALRESGQLAEFRYLHLATHGQANPALAFESALVLSQDQLPSAEEIASGAPFYDGKLTAGEVLETWKGFNNMEMVTLSACESGLGGEGGGEGFLGFAQALLLAGSRSVCLSLWKVDDTATALLMDRFYQNLLGSKSQEGRSLKGGSQEERSGRAGPMPKAEALAEAKRWLRDLSFDEAAELAADLTGGVARGAGRKALPLLPAVPEAKAGERDAKPYSHPTYWAAFVLVGDPE